MNRKFIIVIIAAAIASTLCAAAFAAPVTARLTRLKGDVTMKAAAGKSWVAAKNGDKLSKGDSVKCGKDSVAFITWGNNTVKLGALSAFTFVDLDTEGGAAKSTLKLTDGKMFSRVGKLDKNSRFVVETVNAVSGVRGTAFEASAERFSVLEGSITTTAKDTEVIVEAGKYVDVSVDGVLSQIESLPDAVMQPLKQDNEDCKDVMTEQTTIDETNTTIKDVAETTTDIIPATESLPELLPGHGGFQLNVDVSQ